MAGDDHQQADDAEAEGGANYGDKVTFPVVVTCVIAACCGLIFGYDIGISGGVSQMDSFLQSFFPDVIKAAAAAKQDAYCKYNNQGLTAFNSSIYIAQLLSAIAASYLTRALGRQAMMLAGGCLFLSGAAVNAGAANVAMLIIGRILLGLGVGFASQSAPLYLGEVAPAKWRGGFTTAMFFFLGVGILAATLVNYGTVTIPRWGWRLSLGLAAAPAAVVLLGALLIDDTPSSFVLRGNTEKAKKVLERMRGSGADMDAEMADIVAAVEESRRTEDGAAVRLLRREYRPQLAMAVVIPFFFQLTGVVVLSVYGPVLFRTVGFTSRKAILGSVISSAINIGSIALSSAVVDRVGRRMLFVFGGIIMCICEIAIGWIMGAELGDGSGKVTLAGATAVLVLVCVTTFGFGVSWGPLHWVVLSEVFAVEVRSVAMGINICVSSVLIFAQTEYFFPMLCGLKSGTFYFYAGWVLVMTVCIVLFLPETKGVPLERMGAVWARHWFWRRFVQEQK